MSADDGFRESEAPERTEVTAAAELQRGALRGSLWTVIHVVTAVPVAFAANAVIARALGVDGYGRLAFLTLALSVAVTVTNLGFSEGTLQWGAAAHSRGDLDAVKRHLSWSAGFHIMVQLPLLVAFVLVVTLNEPLSVRIAMLFCVAIPALFGSSTLALTVENRTALSAKMAILSNLMTQTLSASAALALHAAESVWAARNASPAALVPANLAFLSADRRRAVLRPRLPRGLPVGFVSFSLFTAAGSLVGMLVFSRSEIAVLNGYGLLRAAGLFALAFGLAQQITAPVDALLGPLQPAISGMVESHSGRAKEALLRISRVSALAAALIAVTALPLLHAAIPAIYGSDFGPATAAFVVLGISSCLQSVTNPLFAFARARKRADLLLAILSCALVIDLGAAVFAVPRWGLWGAVLANLAGQIVALLAVVRVECRVWGCPTTEYIRALMPFWAACAALAALPLLGLVGLDGFVGSALTVLTCITVVSTTLRVAGARLPWADVVPLFEALPQRVRRPAVFALGHFVEMPKMPSQEVA